MATKINLMKFLQEVRGLGELGRRRPAPRTSPLYLWQLRSHVAETSLAKRRLPITIDLKDVATLPDPVEIKYVQPAQPEEVPSQV